MDVRCEKCLTVYELDDTRVGAGGLTVKCQECGNLFKVRRRPDTAELVVTKEGVPQIVSEPVLEVVPADAATRNDARSDETTAASTRARRVLGEPTAEEREEADSNETTTNKRPELPREIGWMLRSARTGEVLRFRELTTLQAWIVERKVTREDEISRGGESWKPLGGIAELASFFHVVEQAESIARATQPGLAVRRANQLGGLDRDQLAQLPTELNPPLPPSFDDEDGSSTRLAQPRRGSRAVVWGTLALLVGGAAAGGFISWQGRQNVRVARAHDESTAVAKARDAMQLDTDDGFRQAIGILEPLVQPGVDARVVLAEAHVLLATYLAEDAHALEATAAGASRTVSAEAQAHLASARRVLEQPQDQESPYLAVALADLVRAEGQPPASVEHELARARTGAPAPLLLQVEGELALRDGKTEDARTRFSQVTSAHALYRLAQLDAREGRPADEKTACAALFAVSPTHDRGHTLCSAQAAPADLAIAAAPADLGVVAKTETELAKDPASSAPPSGDYKSLVHEGDRLAESGHSRDARKRYERALELDPKGSQALIGLGYCDLEAERFLQAVDRFNAALAVDPDAGDAMVGLAESYRIRGRSAQALELYKKYLAAHPTGDKAPMAQKALRELEHASEPKPEPKSESTPVLDHITVKPQETPPKSEDTPLPRLPSQDSPQ